MRRVSVSRASLHRAGLRRVALPAAGWPCGARRGASGGGGDDNPYFPAGMPQELKDSIVLWYDLERQGATNESMAANPTLKDLSGNGNDATCYNFGWSGMSGIGGYNFNGFQELPNRSRYTKEGYKFNFTEKLSSANNFLNLINCVVGGEVKVKVSGLTNGRKVSFGVSINYSLDNGEHIMTIPEGVTVYPFGVTGAAGSIDVTIEFLPQYPNALVSDGVNDYCLVQDRYACDFVKDYYVYIDDSTGTILRGTGTAEAHKITITSVIRSNQILIEENKTISQSTKIRVTGLPNGVSMVYAKQGVTITKDGEYEIPAIAHTSGIGFYIDTNLPECNITIEQLPLNKKSLVLNKEDGYTVIAKRKWINGNGCIASKSTSIGNGAFIFELRENNQSYSWGVGNSGLTFVINDITYQKSDYYNNLGITAGSATDSDKLFIGTLRGNNNRFANIALYSLLLFNRDLTDEEIEWVKNNLMQ